MSGKLTKAQREGLFCAERGGGIIGFGQHRRTVKILQTRGLLSNAPDNYGYFSITDAGRAALKEPDNAS